VKAMLVSVFSTGHCATGSRDTHCMPPQHVCSRFKPRRYNASGRPRSGAFRCHQLIAVLLRPSSPRFTLTSPPHNATSLSRFGNIEDRSMHLRDRCQWLNSFLEALLTIH
jgi:hypothetical protein